MAISRPNIEKFIKNKPNVSIPSTNKKGSNNQSWQDNPLFTMAKGMAANLPPKIKRAIFLAIYLMIAGIIGNIYAIYQIILWII